MDDAQKEEIANRIVFISNFRIKNNKNDIEESEKKIRQLIRERRAAKKYFPVKFNELKEKNNNKINELKVKIKKTEKELKPFQRELDVYKVQLDKLGYWTYTWDYRERLEQGKGKRELVKAVKKKQKIEKQIKPIEDEIQNLNCRKRKLEYEIQNEEQKHKSNLDKIAENIEDLKTEVYRRSYSILDALQKIVEYDQLEQVENFDYYKYLEVVLERAESDSDIDFLKKSLEVCRNISEIVKDDKI